MYTLDEKSAAFDVVKFSLQHSQTIIDVNLVDFHKQTESLLSKTFIWEKRESLLLAAGGQYHADFTAPTALKAL